MGNKQWAIDKQFPNDAFPCQLPVADCQLAMPTLSYLAAPNLLIYGV